MERRFNRNPSNERGSINLQKQLAENRRTRSENVPDLTDFMNDMFYGTANSYNKKAYNLTGRDNFLGTNDFDSSRRSSVSKRVDDFDSSRRSSVSKRADDFDSSRRSSVSKRADDFDSSRRSSVSKRVDDFDSSRRSSVTKRVDDFDSSRRSSVTKRVDDFDSSRRSSVSNRVDDFDSSRRSVGSRIEDFDSSRRSVSSRSTQEWLEEAKRMVAQSPTRCESPARGSPRFATVQKLSAAASGLDKRDPFSRSARRHRPVDGFSGEIMSKTAKQNCNNSEINQSPPLSDTSPTSTVQKWFSNILNPQNTPIPNPNLPNIPSDPTSPKSINHETTPPLPPRQSTPRKSRFQKSHIATQTQPIPPLTNPPNSKRTFKNAANLTTSSATNSPTRLDPQLLSPPKHLVESSHRRSISSTTCSVPESQILSPPKNLVESAHRRSISASTCSNGKILPKSNVDGQFLEEDKTNLDLNVYLTEQRTKILKIMSGEINSTAKIVLSGPSNSPSLMVAAIGYAWLLINRMNADKNRSSGDGNGEVVVPVMNMKRGKMWKHRQAAWLFHHVGLDANALLFSDEVDLEALMMTKRLNMLVVGEDILRANGEVVSGCSVLTDNYCEDAYDLLQTPMLKKLLLAGILLDTQNLNVYTKSSMTRDAEAIQLLLVGSSSNYRNTLFDELMQVQDDDSFTEILQQNYGKPPSESNQSKRSPVEKSTAEVKVPNADKSSNDSKNGRANTVSPKSGIPTKNSARAPKATAKGADPSRGKNGFFLAKWFGFGSK